MMSDKTRGPLGGWGMSIALAVSGFAALAITIFMNRHAGEAMGATAEGRLLLSAGAIAVDVVGICVFGLAAGALLTARSYWMKALGCVFGIVMLSSVGLSIMSIMNFVGAERGSVDQAMREKAAERQRKTASAEAATKERNRIANETAEKGAEKQRQLAEQHLKWLQGQSRRDDLTRKERKEILSGAGDVIAKVGQVAPHAAEPAPEAPAASEELLVRTEKGAEMIAEFSGLEARAVIALQMGWLAVLLIVYKALAFPGASLLRPRHAEPKEEPSTATAAASAVASVTPLLALPVPGAALGALAAPALLEQPASSVAAAIPEPKIAPPLVPSGPPPAAPKVADDRPVNPFLGRPLPGAEHELREIGFPIDGRPPGPSREKLGVKEEAERFVRALGAFGVNRSISRVGELQRLYRQYAMANHREQVEEAALLDAMKRMATKGCDFGDMRYEPDHPNYNPDKPDNKRQAYKIKSKDYRRSAAAREVGGAKVVPSLAAAANDDVATPLPAKAKPHLAIVPTRSFQPEQERWAIAMSRAHKFDERGWSRKQRGSRMHKMSRAA